MNVNLQWPHDRQFATPQVGEDTVFHFHTPSLVQIAAGAVKQVLLQSCYGRQGAAMLRTSRLQGPGVDATKVSKSAAFSVGVGPEHSFHFGSFTSIVMYGLTPDSDYTLTVSTPSDPGGQTTEMFGDILPSSG